MSDRRPWDRELGYERPQERWQCAHRAAGRPCCSEGPTPTGRCGGTHECRPMLRGESWECTRSPARGGDCEEGPLPDGTCCRPVSPCQPLRSQRALRGLVVRRTAAVAVALMLLGLLGGSRERWLSPGELSSEHASLAVGGSACGSCHPGAVGLPLIGASAASSAAGGREGATAGCLGCHDLGAAARSPHSLPGPVLDAATAAQRERHGAAAVDGWRAFVTAALDGEQAAEPACGSCHREHRGRGSSVLAVDDGPCGACHVAQFESLSHGHPDFLGFPLSAERVGEPRRARTRLAFDHSSHATLHFPKEEAEFRCVDCHVLDGAGRNVGVVGFERSCASCHSADVVSGELVLLALPNLDTRSLEASELGTWPRTSRKKRPVELLHLLLLADPELDPLLAEALRTGEVNDSNDLSRLRGEEQARMALELAWATKRLLHELASDDAGAALKRLAVLSSGEEGPDPRLLAGLSQDLVGPAAASWFPELERELALRARVREASGEPAPPAPEPPAEGAGAPAAADAPAAVDPEQAAAAAERDAAREAERAAAAEELRALAEAEPPSEPWWSARGKDGLAAGGWYREDRNALIAYRPTGHADPVVRAWVEKTALLRAGSEPATNLALTLLDPVEGAGRCTKCHTLDGTGPDMVVNWRGVGDDDESGSFTVFRHGPHVTLLDDDTGCETCHSLDRTRLVSEEGVFAGRDPAEGGSSFADVDREACASCHVPEGAGDSCTDCHRYHVGAAASDRGASLLASRR